MMEVISFSYEQSHLQSSGMRNTQQKSFFPYIIGPGFVGQYITSFCTYLALYNSPNEDKASVGMLFQGFMDQLYDTLNAMLLRGKSVLWVRIRRILKPMDKCWVRQYIPINSHI